VDVNKLIDDTKKKVPIDHYALQKGPEKEWREDEWVRTILTIWDTLRDNRRELNEISLFGEYYTPENARFLLWFVSPGAAEKSLEKDLLTAEDIFLLNWKLRFTDFSTIEKQVEGTVIDRPKLIQHCKYMIHLIDVFNSYFFEVHSRDADYGPEKDKWELFIQRLEGLISQEEMKKLSIQKEAEEKKKTIEKKMETDKKIIQAKEEAIKNDPFSVQNLFKQDDDPFQDILLLEVVDIYGNLEGESWSNVPRADNFETPDSDDYYNNLLKELDMSALDTGVSSFQIPSKTISKKQ